MMYLDTALVSANILGLSDFEPIEYESLQLFLIVAYFPGNLFYFPWRIDDMANVRRCNAYNYIWDKKQLGRHIGETMNK